MNYVMVSINEEGNEVVDERLESLNEDERVIEINEECIKVSNFEGDIRDEDERVE